MNFLSALRADTPPHPASQSAHPEDLLKSTQAPAATPGLWRRFRDYFFPSAKRGPVLYLLTSITLVYLLLEFAFNARLLDAVGGISSADAIEGIEIWGRCLSGFACALFFWPLVLKGKITGTSKRLLTLGAVTGVVMSVMYVGERELVDFIVRMSSPAQRYASANLMLLQQSLVTGDAHVQDLDLSVRQMNAPDGKAFLATFPILLLQINDVEKRIADQKATLVRRAVDKAYGGPVGAFNHYVDALKELKTAYDGQYLPGTRKYQAALNTIPARQAEAWADYERSLRLKGMSPDSVPLIHHDRVRREVRRKGVTVPNNWRPNDHAGFNQAIAGSVKSTADNEYQAGVRNALGEYIAPNLSAEAFMLSPPIQRRLLAGLRFPCEVTVKLGYQTPAEFDRGVYGHVVDLVTRQKLNSLSGRLEDYANGARFEHSGKDSMRALIAPPMALAFSVAGAVAHILKLTFFLLLECALALHFRNGWYKFGAIMLGIVLMMASFSTLLSSQITRQPLYQQHVHAAALNDQGGLISLWHAPLVHAIRGTIQVQPYAYPLFEWVRHAVFQDLDFGFQPDTGPAPAPSHAPEKPASCVKTS
ncbi:hypothetical protein [Curvibacter gracilis]|uniref:hypothetical protein n=1 Tax=Curvibacter gracilis TaxID=230310 RepID=UPI00048279DF|nr:hypothetical protein [Curvibacter gracilis]